jgi:hypothetical protein
MGAPMALNLIRAGHRVVVYNRTPLAPPHAPMAVGPFVIGSDRHIPLTITNRACRLRAAFSRRNVGLFEAVGTPAP